MSPVTPVAASDEEPVPRHVLVAIIEEVTQESLPYPDPPEDQDDAQQSVVS